MKKTFFICDACGETVQNPHKAKMKEFRYKCEYDFGILCWAPKVIPKTIHLCDKCFKGLGCIVEKT